MKRESTIERRRQIFEEAAAIIQREYAGELDLDALARRVAASPRQLQRVFSEVGGTCFRSYLAEVRMRRAAELLHRGEGAVHDVASSVGYRHRAQFTKAFRRHHGAPPSSLRTATPRRPRGSGPRGMARSWPDRPRERAARSPAQPSRATSG